MCAQTEKNVKDEIFQNFWQKKIRELTKKDRRKGPRPFTLGREPRPFWVMAKEEKMGEFGDE